MTNEQRDVPAAFREWLAENEIWHLTKEEAALAAWNAALARIAGQEKKDG